MKLLKSFFSLLLLLSVVCIQSSFAQDSTIPLADNVEITDSEGQSYQAVETVLVNAISDLSDGFIDPQELETADYLVSTGPQGVLVTNDPLLSPRVAETDDGRVIKGRTYIYDWNGEKLIWSHRLE